MASLAGQQLKDTYDSLLKVDDNGPLGGTYKEITDGLGNGSNVYLGTGGRVGVGSASPAVELDVNGEIRASSGILFGTDTATANALDDYEEGTWTPAWSFATSGSATISIDSATYTKIGRVVNVNARFFTSSISSPVGTATLTGLPFTANSTIYDVPGSVSELIRWATDIQNLKVFVINNQSYLEMTFNSATDANATNLSGSDFSTSAGARNIISISVTYFV